MRIIPFLIKELEQEAATTRKFFKLIPTNKFDWKPHEKSMSVKALSVHIAEIPGWIGQVIHQDVIDFSATPYQPVPVNNTEDLFNLLEKSVSESLDALVKTNEDELLKTWTMKNGDQVLMAMTKYEAIRHSFAQLTHHRAQLGVDLRLLNIPIPGSYGPSADEKWG